MKIGMKNHWITEVGSSILLIFLISAERDWWLYHVSDFNWSDFVMYDLSGPSSIKYRREGCDQIFKLLLSAVTGESFEDISLGGKY